MVMALGSCVKWPLVLSKINRNGDTKHNNQCSMCTIFKIFLALEFMDMRGQWVWVLYFQLAYFS